MPNKHHRHPIGGAGICGLRGHANGTSEVATIIKALQTKFQNVIKEGGLKFRIGKICHCHQCTEPRFRDCTGGSLVKIYGRSGCQTFIVHCSADMRLKVQNAIRTIWREKRKWR